MEDHKIVDLYWARNEQGIAESDRKYGKILRSLSFSLLSSHEDAEECVNDTYLDAWNAMPTARPTYLGAFLSKITRRISIDRFRADHRQKRGGMGMILEELSDCIPSPDNVEREYENRRLTRTLEAFLSAQAPERRVIFVRRYFYSQSVGEIASSLGLSESKVKVTLYRLREALRQELEEQDLL
ncbi:MAG: sigma-70 family RNA polymerase sigma factor [Clostridia bacterium]|nr:sigma-70 family RNA polymerase sigma factor [Clostridia bacterium]